MKVWIFIGIIKLLVLTYQDLKNKMWVDDRANFLMAGLTIALVSYYRPSLWFLLFLIGFNITLIALFKKFKVFGDADLNTIAWTFTGFGVIGLGVLVGFMSILALCFIITTAINKFIVKAERVPGYPMFLISFILTIWLFNVWNYDALVYCFNAAQICT